MRVIYHNWSATKQRPHPQSVAEISRHSVLSGGTGFHNVIHRLGLATRTQIRVCKSPFPSAGTAVSLFRAKTVQQRPLLNLLNHYTPTHSLRSSSQLLLQTNPTRTVLSQRAFSSAAPRVWNSLPDKLRSCSTLDTFRRTLKTLLFSVAFDA